MRIALVGSTLQAVRQMANSDPAMAEALLSRLRGGLVENDEVASSVNEIATALRDPTPDRAVDSASRAINALAGRSNALRLKIDVSETHAERVFRQTAISVGAIAFVLTLASFLMTRRVTRSINRALGGIVESIEDAGRNTVRRRLVENGDGEIRRLATAFNRLFENLDGAYERLEQDVDAKARELVESRRMAQVGVLAASVAHEINNPLAVIAGYGQRLASRLKGGPDAKLTSAADVIVEEAFRCKHITDALLNLARPVEGGQASFCLRELIEQRAKRLHESHLGVPIAITGPSVILNHSLLRLTQLIDNLLTNALWAVSKRVNPRIEIALAADGTACSFDVRDNGVGADLQTVERAFERFYSGRQGGTGIGLTIAREIAQSCGGSISMHSDGPDAGATLRVSLPLEGERAIVA